jgi:hypothetical protein
VLVVVQPELVTAAETAANPEGRGATLVTGVVEHLEVLAQPGLAEAEAEAETFIVLTILDAVFLCVITAVAEVSAC